MLYEIWWLDFDKKIYDSEDKTDVETLIQNLKLLRPHDLLVIKEKKHVRITKFLNYLGW